MRLKGYELLGLSGLLWGTVACDVGNLGFGSDTPGTGVGVVETGRRVALASDADFEFCPGNLARWSADLDRIDSFLGIDAPAELTRLTLLEDPNALLDSCEGAAGCYLRRPDGPESVAAREDNDGRMVAYFVHDRLEIGWSTRLPPFVEVGLGEAFAGRSCSNGQASLESLLARGRGEALTPQEAAAAGQWMRTLLEHAGAERLQDFASKIELASSEGYIRSVFAEVYGVPIDATWEDAASESVAAPPGGWCREPALPMVDGHAQLVETLDCSGPRTQHLDDGRYRVAYRVSLQEGETLRVEGAWPASVRVSLAACSCGAPGGLTVTPGEALGLGAGTWLLELSSLEARAEPVALELFVEAGA